jgi:polyhydroxyalkanoate synthesis regulator phasin
MIDGVILLVEDDANGKFVTWKLFGEKHQELAEQIVVNSKRLDILEKTATQLGDLSKDTNEKITDHIAKEDVTWVKYDGRLDKLFEAIDAVRKQLEAMKAQIAGPASPKSIKYSTIRFWGLRIAGVAGSLAAAYYYLHVLRLVP